MVSAASLFSLLACANEQPPPGALPDHDPPRVEQIDPAPDSVVPGFHGKVRIHFDEPVRIQQGFATQLLASPMGIYDIDTGFSDLRIRPRDGWRDSVVYCLEIPEGIPDLLNNRTQTSTSFCFSTGIPISDTRITGTVLDAVTGQVQNEARVIFLAAPDSTPYGALTDADGRFSIRALPPGSYHAFGFLDQNRNFNVDRKIEPHDSVTVTASEGARPDLLFHLVDPDSTPPRLFRAEAPDSVTVVLEFDDPLLRVQPGQPSVTVADSVTGARLSVFGVAVGEAASVRFPGAPEDSAGVAGDSISAAATPASDLPSRFVTVRLSEAIYPGTFRVQANGFLNLRHLSGGGDTTFVAEVGSKLPEDTTGVVPDSAVAATRDTLTVPPDTLAVPPDTSRVRR